MSNEIVSVIVPVYNVELYLADCIESIINQTYRNMEIILVDDGSYDDSGNICDFYVHRDERIRVIHKKNGGLSDARNKGILESRGNYIALIDSDDFIAPNFIEVFMDIMLETNCDMVCCEFQSFFDGDEKKIWKKWDNDENIPFSYRVYNSQELLDKVFYQRVSITGAQQKLYKRSLFNEISFPQGRLYEDLATTYRFIIESKKIAIINRCLYAYRIRENSIMTKNFSKKNLDCIWVANLIIQDVKKICPENLKSATCAAFRINRIVFQTVPKENKIEKEQVWNQIVKYRKIVCFDRQAPAYERVIASSTYCGNTVFTAMLKIFMVCRKKVIKYKYR